MHSVIGIIIIRMKKSKADYREITLFPIYSNPPSTPRGIPRLGPPFGIQRGGARHVHAGSVGVVSRSAAALFTHGRESLVGGARAFVCVCVCVRGSVWRKRARRGEIEAEA